MPTETHRLLLYCAMYVCILFNVINTIQKVSLLQSKKTISQIQNEVIKPIKIQLKACTRHQLLCKNEYFEFLKILRIHENQNKTSQNFPTIVLPVQYIPISNQSHNRNNSQLLFRKSCHLPSNLLHLDNSGTDQLLDLVHHTRVLGMFLCSLRIFLEINQYLSHNRVLKDVLNFWI